MSFSLFASTITVATAANVSYAMPAIIKAFEKEHPDIQVRTILGSSGKLTAQIRHGAPYQIFMAANMKYPEALYDANYAITRPRVYAQGSLAILSVKPRDFSKKLTILLSEDIKKITIANPKTAPYGNAAMGALQEAKVYHKIRSKLIYAESASQALTYTLKATDAGFVAMSSLYSPKLRHFKEGVNFMKVNPKLYDPIQQGIVILKKGQNRADVKAFYNFILSQKAQEILRAYGYTIS